MKPDRANYEIWIIDWLDGKLDKSSVEMLMAFLESNPDLKKEADSLYFSRLASGNLKFRAKNSLKKTALDLPLSQVEFLSVAYLEKDITPDQMSDLKQFTDLSPENKRVFETIQKIRLVPPQLSYKNKNSLKRQTAGAKVFRLAAVGLSAAATIAVLIVSYIFITRYFPGNNPDDDQIIAAESYSVNPFEVRTRIFMEPSAEPAGKDLFRTIPSVIPETVSTDIITGQSAVLAVADTSPVITRSSIPEIRNIPVSMKPEILMAMQGQYIAKANNSLSSEPYDEDRSRLNRFIAKTFREKILKEPVLSDAPLKSYEIAEAGIDGLNKLLGWEMAIVRNNDEGGDLKSIYFSSRLLKFNAPVRKTEPLP